MKNRLTLVLALVLTLSPVLAHANCTNHTYFVDGKIVICSTCCYGTNCTTSCY